MLLKGFALLLAMRQVGYSVAHVTSDLRHRFVRALIAARWDFFSLRPAGGFANTISNEAERAGRAYEALCQIAALSVQALMYLALTLLVSWQVALAALAAGGVMVLVLGRLVGLARQAGRKQTTLMQGLMTRIADGLGGMKPLKAMAREQRLETHLHETVEGLNETARKSVFYRYALSTMVEPIIVLFLGAGVLLAHGALDIPLATQMFMALLFFRLVTRIGTIQQQWQIVMSTESAYWALLETLEAAERAREPHKSGRKPALPAVISVERVSFAYEDKTILDQVSLEVRPGEITTVIGPSGAGKTTLADLLIGLRRAGSGRIVIGGLDLRDIDLDAWRSAVGYVPQELFLFHTTLLENVGLGDPEIDRGKVETALRQAGAWPFVAELAEGLDTIVGEGGTRLSGGQRQRIAIARALVRDPALLILDEATTALDPETEAAICATVRTLAAGRAVLAITHQPAWIGAAERVYRIAAGRVTVEKGPHSAGHIASGFGAAK
jgi:ATP-binding cassette subfamily C protein